MTAGTILAGKYRLVSLLGRGAMGSVWRAERLGWQAPVAIKLMNVVSSEDSRALARFQREARLAASLRSIHVVQVLDDGVDPGTGAPFIVMELLEGETLAERLQRIGRFRPPMVAQIISQIARALGRAHEAGLIHRDLKPDNILIMRNDDEEILKVLDFGIAKWMAAPPNRASGTLAGQMLGTPIYMSPEHFASSSTLDHRADLWSLGVIAFECMTGARPFDGETLVSLALNVCSGKRPQPSSFAAVPDGFDAWFARAAAPKPDDRFPSARIMAEELRGLCGQMPMLWEPDAAAPAMHSTREKTELEPVLELTRRSQSSQGDEPRLSVTQLDSVRNVFRTPAPVLRRRWIGGIAALASIVTVIALKAPEWGSGSVGEARAKLEQVRSSFRGVGEGQGAPGTPVDVGAAAPIDPTSLGRSESAPLPESPAAEPVRRDADADAGSMHPRVAID